MLRRLLRAAVRGSRAAAFVHGSAMSLVLSIFLNDITPIFVLAGVGFLLARRAAASVRTLATVSFHALSPCLVFAQLVTARIGLSQSWRVALLCVLLTAAIGLAARAAASALRLEGTTRDELPAGGDVLEQRQLRAAGRAVRVRPEALGVLRRCISWRDRCCTPSASSSPRPAQQASADALGGDCAVPAVYGLAVAAIVLATGVRCRLAVMRPVGTPGRCRACR